MEIFLSLLALLQCITLCLMWRQRRLTTIDRERLRALYQWELAGQDMLCSMGGYPVQVSEKTSLKLGRHTFWEYTNEHPATLAVPICSISPRERLLAESDWIDRRG